MDNLVFIEPGKLNTEPFTTSKVVSEQTGVAHRHVKKQIEAHKSELQSFGLLVACATESTGGRPLEIIALTEPQATLLITFLKNTPVVVKFKTELVRQFFIMRTELYKRQALRESLKPIHRELTEIIKDIDRCRWDYMLYTNLGYRAVTGMNASQLRKARNAPRNAIAVEFMTADEIEHVAKVEHQIGVLLEMGLEYAQVKDLLFNRRLIEKSA